jgi:alcohol dehydrogenase
MPQPQPGQDEILVRVRAAGLNPVDYKIRNGELRVPVPLKLPIALGNELAGDVIAVGSSVVGFSVGDRVYARLSKDKLGAFAEFARVDAVYAAPMPPSLDYAQAAAVPLAGLTALQALRNELSLKPGQKLFISGGAGGVGTFAIQIAKWLGAYVATTASPRGDALVRSLGADEVIDYTKQDFGSVLSGFDAGFDLIGGDTLNRMFSIIKPGGKIVSVAGVPEPQMALKDLGGRYGLAAALWVMSFAVRARARKAGVGYRYLFMHPSGEDLRLLAELIESGRLKVVTDRLFPFADMAEALAYVESGKAKGKVVVTMA